MSDLRSILHSAYAFIRSVEVNKAVASLTLDHLIQEQLNRYQSKERNVLDAKGASMGNRISYLDALDGLEKDINSVVDALNDKGTDQAKLADMGLNEEGSSGGSTA